MDRRDRIRKFIKRSIIFISLTLVFSGCTSERSRGGKHIKLMWWGDVYNRPFIEKAIRIYSEKNKDVKISLVTPTGAYNTKLITMAVSKTLPDVVLLSCRQIPNLKSKGVLLSLDELANDEEFIKLKQDFWSGALESAMYEGSLYGVPVWAWTLGLYYNKDAFDEGGVPYPKDGWTWDDYLEMLKKVTKIKDGKIVRFSSCGLWLTLDNLFLIKLIKDFGGDIYNDELTKCLLNKPESIAALQWFMDLEHKYHIVPTSAEVAGIDMVPGTWDYFSTGFRATDYSGRDSVDRVRKSAKFKWGVAPLPRGKYEYVLSNFVYLSISSKTKNLSASWDLVRFFVSHEGQKLIAADRSDIPILRSVTYKDEYINYAGVPEANKTFRGLMEKAEPYPYIPGSDKWRQYFVDQMALVRLHRVSLKKACDNIVNAFDTMVMGER